MKRKLIAILTTVLVLLSVPPMSASALVTNSSSTVLEVECLVPDITVEVTVPGSSRVYINPLSIPVSMGGTINDGQILSELAYIENRSTVPVSVSATVTGTVNPGSSLELRTRSTEGVHLTTKQAFIYFEMQAADSPANVSWDDSYDRKKHIPVYYDVEEKEDFLTLGAVSQDMRYGVFRLTEDCVAEPVDDPWTFKDGVTATVAFTFRPVPFS